jgi:predicted signal transduction protein with EAL and GGDEF domain
MRIVLVNRAAETILERTAAEMSLNDGFSISLTIRTGCRSDWTTVRARARRRSCTGMERQASLSIHASTIRNAPGKVIGSAALIRDVTEEKRLEARLEQQAITDALTGIFNRRHFDEVIETEYKRWKRYGQPVSVMMIDVDHFKKFNDTHGHDCGDHVLGAIGRLLLELSAPAQIPCRFGGEEMIVLMPGVVEDGRRGAGGNGAAAASPSWSWMASG